MQVSADGGALGFPPRKVAKEGPFSPEDPRAIHLLRVLMLANKRPGTEAGLDPKTTQGF